MKTKDIIRQRRTLELLHGVGACGMTKELLQEYVAVEAGEELTHQEMTDLLVELSANGWVRSYRNPILQQVRYIITGTGEGARAAFSAG